MYVWKAGMIPKQKRQKEKENGGVKKRKRHV